MIKRSLILVAIIASFAVNAYAQGFPNIRSAQDSLQDAIDSLERAPAGFGGHKAQAMRLIRAAHEELDLAMEFRSERRR